MAQLDLSSTFLRPWRILPAVLLVLFGVLSAADDKKGMDGSPKEVAIDPSNGNLLQTNEEWEEDHLEEMLSLIKERRMDKRVLKDSKSSSEATSSISLDDVLDLINSSPSSSGSSKSSKGGSSSSEDIFDNPFPDFDLDFEGTFPGFTDGDGDISDIANIFTFQPPDNGLMLVEEITAFTQADYDALQPGDDGFVVSFGPDNTLTSLTFAGFFYSEGNSIEIPMTSYWISDNYDGGTDSFVQDGVTFNQILDDAEDVNLAIFLQDIRVEGGGTADYLYYAQGINYEDDGTGSYLIDSARVGVAYNERDSSSSSSGSKSSSSSSSSSSKSSRRQARERKLATIDMAAAGFSPMYSDVRTANNANFTTIKYPTAPLRIRIGDRKLNDKKKLVKMSEGFRNKEKIAANRHSRDE